MSHRVRTNDNSRVQPPRMNRGGGQFWYEPTLENATSMNHITPRRDRNPRITDGDQTVFFFFAFSRPAAFLLRLLPPLLASASALSSPALPQSLISFLSPPPPHVRSLSQNKARSLASSVLSPCLLQFRGSAVYNFTSWVHVFVLYFKCSRVSSRRPALFLLCKGQYYRVRKFTQP